MILTDPIIRPIITNQDLVTNSLYNRNNDYVINPIPSTSEVLSTDAVPKDIFEFYDKMDQDDGNDAVLTKKKVVQLEIFKDKIEVLQKRYEIIIIFSF